MKRNDVVAGTCVHEDGLTFHTVGVVPLLATLASEDMTNILFTNGNIGARSRPDVDVGTVDVLAEHREQVGRHVGAVRRATDGELIHLQVQVHHRTVVGHRV